ncbi:MAG: STAS domain-containing protein [Planctomycetes bacterium]|jgi:anti-anti-sigma factor|nr:STAS domain-containing protein [Phycisphaerae bacterium]NBB94476.1 STAS domain-containing protein [Planctomycetota bacterium]
MPEGLVINRTEGITTAMIRYRSLLEGDQIDRIGHELYTLVDEMDHQKVIVDFRQVNFLASAMIGTLVALHKKAEAIDGKVILVGLKPNLMKVFEITNLHKVLNFAETEEQAAKQFDPLQT